MSEQNKLLLKEIGDILLEFLVTCMGEGAIPKEVARIRARDIVTKAKQHYEQKRLDRPELREAIAHLVCGHPECYGRCLHYRGKKTPCASVVPDQILALIPDIEEARKQEREEHWIDAPNKRGDYWMSPFVEGRYIQPRFITVIDYQREDRGLEVQYDFPHDTIPVATFCKEYYPEAKWLFIPIPNWQALKEEK